MTIKMWITDTLRWDAVIGSLREITSAKRTFWNNELHTFIQRSEHPPISGASIIVLSFYPLGTAFLSCLCDKCVTLVKLLNNLYQSKYVNNLNTMKTRKFWKAHQNSYKQLILQFDLQKTFTRCFLYKQLWTIIIGKRDKRRLRECGTTSTTWTTYAITSGSHVGQPVSIVRDCGFSW